MQDSERQSGKPIDFQDAPRFAGIKTFMRLPHAKTPTQADFAIIGVPFDGGASFRTGQRQAPEAIRSMSVLLREYHPVHDIAIFDWCQGIDYGDVAVLPGYIEETYLRITQEIRPLVNSGVVPLLLGGDHSVSLPSLRALAEAHGPLALVHFDSHNDTEQDYAGKLYYHGTPFRRAVEEGLLDVAHSVQIGMHGSVCAKEELEDAEALGFQVLPMPMIREKGIPHIIAAIRERVGTANVFISFDIDAVDPAYAPGTGTPEVGGLTSWEALSLIRGLRGVHLVGADLVEVVPAYDPATITALLAANLVYEWIALLALQKQTQAE